jgi:hypothetical protein
MRRSGWSTGPPSLRFAPGTSASRDGFERLVPADKVLTALSIRLQKIYSGFLHRPPLPEVPSGHASDTIDAFLRTSHPHSPQIVLLCEPINL